MDIVFTQIAQDDLAEIKEFYLENYSQQIWNDLVDEFEKGFNFIKEYPMGSSTPSELDGFNLTQFRQSIINHYKVIYEVQDNTVLIIIVCHEKRNMTTQLEKRMFGI